MDYKKYIIVGLILCGVAVSFLLVPDGANDSSGPKDEFARVDLGNAKGNSRAEVPVSLLTPVRAQRPIQQFAIGQNLRLQDELISRLKLAPESVVAINTIIADSWSKLARETTAHAERINLPGFEQADSYTIKPWPAEGEKIRGEFLKDISQVVDGPTASLIDAQMPWTSSFGNLGKHLTQIKFYESARTGEMMFEAHDYDSFGNKKGSITSAYSNIALNFGNAFSVGSGE